MATNHTENLNLNLWEPEDKFLREEFNENWEKIDAGIHSLDTAVQFMSESLVLGSYAGNGLAVREFELGFQPKALLIWTESGAQDTTQYCYGGLAFPGFPCKKTGRPIFEVTETGFIAYRDPAHLGSNNESSSYYYLAFR